MSNDEVTIEILRGIRDAVQETNGRIDQTNLHLEEQTVRLDRLDSRIVESELRTSTAIGDLKGTMDDVKTLLATRLDVRDRVDRCERDIELIKARLAG